MSNVLSPTVTYTETSLPHYIPKVTSEIGAFVGFFEKGPINRPVYITNLNQFKVIFGRGIDIYHNDWYQVYNYLQYASGIWVCRSSGCQQYNANTIEPISILDKADYDSIKDSLVFDNDGISIIAKTPGESGNLITVTCIDNEQWDMNVTLFATTKAKDVFKFFEENYIGICVFRNNQLMETFYINEYEISELDKSTYVYFKLSDDVRAFYGNTAKTLTYGSTNLPTDNDLAESYEIFDKDNYDIDIIIGNEKDNSLAIKLAETRRDCIAFIGIPTSFIELIKLEMGEDPREVLYTEDGIILLLSEFKNKKTYSDIEFGLLFDYLNSLQKSQFCHFTCNVKEQYDGFSDKNRLVNIAADAAGLKAQASLLRPWAPGAGLEKGQILNVSSIYIDFKKAQLDELYKLGLNYIEKNILITQKTFMTKDTQFNRINIRSLFNHIEKTTSNILKKYIFETNLLNVRRIIAGELKQLLLNVRANNGISSGSVNVYPDPTNPEIITIDISIKPIYIAEYINLRMTNVGTALISELI